MRKVSIITGMTLAGVIGLGAYILANKNTKIKADKLINSVLDKASLMTKDMME